MDQNKRYLLLRTRILGQKFYEISNHLGNVLEVITDRKVAHDNTGSIDYYEADVVKYSDYYPFGMQMPGRNGTISGGDYRYAFNGMETDGEVSGGGNSYTTQFRQYDPRLGRWKSLDPLMGKYPSMSPFIGMGNNPNFYTDVLGLEPNGGPKKGSGTKDDPYSTDGKFNTSDLDNINPAEQPTVWAEDGTYSYEATYNTANHQWTIKTTSKKTGKLAPESTFDAPDKTAQNNTANESKVEKENKDNSANVDIQSQDSGNNGITNEGLEFTETQAVLGTTAGLVGETVSWSQEMTNLEKSLANGDVLAKFDPNTNSFNLVKNGKVVKEMGVAEGVAFQSASKSLAASKSLKLFFKGFGIAGTTLCLIITLDQVSDEGGFTTFTAIETFFTAGGFLNTPVSIAGTIMLYTVPLDFNPSPSPTFIRYGE